jgi:hypothetical protein
MYWGITLPENACLRTCSVCPQSVSVTVFPISVSVGGYKVGTEVDLIKGYLSRNQIELCESETVFNMPPVTFLF